MTNKNSKTHGFMEMVQAHERAWGNDDYPGRPDLQKILESPVVIFWEPVTQNSKEKEIRLIVSLHDTLNELDDYFSKIIFRSAVEMPKQRVVKIYQDKKPVVVRGVKVAFGGVLEEK